MGVKIFPRSEHELRMRRAKGLMKRDGLDAIVATDPKNFHYLTAGWRLGFDPVGYMIEDYPLPARPGMIIVPLDGDPVALVPSLFSWSSERGWIDDVRTWHGLPFTVDHLERALIDMNLSGGRIGMELGEELRLDLPCVEYEKMKRDLSKAQFVPSDIFWDLRIIKSRAEADKIRRACEITGEAFEKFFTIVREGMTVRDVIRTLYNCYMGAGALRPSFPPNLGLDLDAKTLKKGSVYSLDTSAVFDDYTADICRVAVVGRATAIQEEMYEKCVELNDAVRGASRAGARTREIWDVYTRAWEELEVARRRVPDRIGHGFGLLGNEPPTLGPNDEYVLEAGNVHCIEPGVGTPDEYFYIEENVWVTRTGSELLSRSVSRELWEI